MQFTPLFVLVLAVAVCHAVEIPVSTSYQGGIRGALVTAQSGDVLRLEAGGIYSWDTSCNLLLSIPNITISGPEDVAHDQRPVVTCNDTGQFAIITAPGVILSHLQINRLNLSTMQEGLIGGACILAQGSGNGVIVDHVILLGCNLGALHLQNGAYGIVSSSVIQGSVGAACIISEGSELKMSDTQVIDTINEGGTTALSKQWYDLCGQHSSEDDCLSNHPITANETLCEATGMKAKGNFETEWYGGRVRQCPGTNDVSCIVYQQLNLPAPATLTSETLFQAPGGDFYGTCAGFCAAFGLQCLMAWHDMSDTCEPNPESALSCSDRGMQTSDHVCSCVRTQHIVPRHSSSIHVNLGKIELDHSHIVGFSNAGIFAIDSTIIMSDSTISGGESGVYSSRSFTTGVRMNISDVEIGIYAETNSTTILQSSHIHRIGREALHDIAGTVNLTNVVLEGCGAEGIEAHSSLVNLVNVVSRDNSGSGFFSRKQTVSNVIDSVFTNNSNGGVVFDDSIGRLESCEIHGNRVVGSGGGLNVKQGSSVEIVDVDIHDNWATMDGGGVYCDGINGGSISIHGGIVSNNVAKRLGGGLRVEKMQAVVKTLDSSNLGGNMGGAQTNGTHLIFLSTEFVFAALQLSEGPGKGKIGIVSGELGVSGVRDGVQNSATPPRFKGADLSFFVINSAKTKIYHCESEVGRIRVISLPSGDVTTLAGGVENERVMKDGVGTSASFIGPMSATLSVDEKVLWVVDANARSSDPLSGLRKVVLATGMVSTVIQPGYGYKDGSFGEALFKSPAYSVLDHTTNTLYVSESIPSRIRAVHLDEGYVSTLAGGSDEEDDWSYQRISEQKTTTSFRGITWMTFDKKFTTLFVADSERILTVKMSSKYVEVFAGSDRGWIDGSKDLARFSLVNGLAFSDDFRNLYFTDWYNKCIRALVFPEPTVIEGTSFINNQAGWAGGGASLSTFLHRPDGEANIVLNRSNFDHNNNAVGVGGGLAADHIERLDVLMCVFNGNTAKTLGGGAYLQFLGQVEFVNCTFEEKNRAFSGAAAYIHSQWTFDTSQRFAEDPSYVRPEARVRLGKSNYKFYSSVIDGNEGDFEGALAFHGDCTVEMKAIVVTNNVARFGAGVHFSDWCVLDMKGAVVLHNKASSSGGGIMLTGFSKCKLLETLLRGNEAAYGGAIFFGEHAQVSLVDVKVVENRAAFCGGGLVLNSTNEANFHGTVTFQGNQAWDGRSNGNGGGLCVIFPDEVVGGKLVKGKCRNMTNSVLAISGEARIVMKENSAELGGADMFINCRVESHDTAKELLRNVKGGRLSSLTILRSGSTSGYGDLLAFPPGYAQLLSAPISYFPGDVVISSLQLNDHAGQHIRRLSGAPVVELVQIHVVFTWDSDWLGSDDELGQRIKHQHEIGQRNSMTLGGLDRLYKTRSAAMNSYLFGFGKSGIAEDSWLRIQWPYREIIPADRAWIVYEFTSQDEIHPISYWATRKPCTPGTYVLSVEEREQLRYMQCQACPADTYSILSDSQQCHQCPPGAFCNRGLWLSSRVNDSVWEEADGLMRITTCPTGYILVRDEMSPQVDQCVQCPIGTYLDMPPDLKKGFLVTARVFNATWFCHPCPDGFQCLGGDKMGPLDIQVFPVSNGTSPGTVRLGPACRLRMTECAKSEQNEAMTFRIVDDLGRTNLNITWVLHLQPDWLYGSAQIVSTRRWVTSSRHADKVEGNVMTVPQMGFGGEGRRQNQQVLATVYEARIITEQIGSWVLEFTVNGKQLDNSPFVMRVIPRQSCKDIGRVPDESGDCVCPSGYFESGASCLSIISLIVGVIVPVTLVSLLFAFLLDRHRKDIADNWWRLDADEIMFCNPPKVLGQGSFGWVVQAQYRGTSVAVKRMLVTDKDDVGTVEKGQGEVEDESKHQARCTSGGFCVRSPTNGSLGLWSGYSLGGCSIGGGSQQNIAAMLKKSIIEQQSSIGDTLPLGSRPDRKVNGSASLSSVVEQKEESVDEIFIDRTINSKRTASVARSGIGEHLQGSWNGTDSRVKKILRGVKDSSSVEKGDKKHYIDSSTHSSGVWQSCFPNAKDGRRERSLQERLIRSWTKRQERRKAIRSFLEEIRTITKLRHPNICLVLGAVMSYEDPMLVMEHMEHGSLYDILQNETVVLDGVILSMIVTDVIQGMQFLSSSSPPIVHGDLKTRNVLIDSTFRAKVTDFGLSQQRKAGAGTPFWMAPELLLGEESTVKSDVYAFGITLYEIFTRQDPFQGEDLLTVLRKVVDPSIPEVYSRPVIPLSVPATITTQMHACWAFEPKDRPTFFDLHKWINTLDSSAVNTHGTTSRVNGVMIRATEQRNIALLDMFPKHVAEALVNGKIPPPDESACASILFSDVVDFTTLQENLTATEITDLLDRLYSHFDKLSAIYGVFKVETVGDSYVAVTNLAEPQPDDHAERIALFALKCQEAATQVAILDNQPELGTVRIRIGIHSGPVVASVIGTRSKKYCLFGDAVNTASRMEAMAPPDIVHVSKATARLLIEQGAEVGLVERGMIEVMGKGRMRTYYVVHPRLHDGAIPKSLQLKLDSIDLDGYIMAEQSMAEQSMTESAYGGGIVSTSTLSKKSNRYAAQGGPMMSIGSGTSSMSSYIKSGRGSWGKGNGRRRLSEFFSWQGEGWEAGINSRTSSNRHSPGLRLGGESGRWRSALADLHGPWQPLPTSLTLQDQKQPHTNFLSRQSPTGRYNFSEKKDVSLLPSKNSEIVHENVSYVTAVEVDSTTMVAERETTDTLPSVLQHFTVATIGICTGSKRLSVNMDKGEETITGMESPPQALTFCVRSGNLRSSNSGDYGGKDGQLLGIRSSSIGSGTSADHASTELSVREQAVEKYSEGILPQLPSPSLTEENGALPTNSTKKEAEKTGVGTAAGLVIGAEVFCQQGENVYDDEALPGDVASILLEI